MSRERVPVEVAEFVLTRDRGCVASRHGFAPEVRCAGRLHVHHMRLRSQGGPHTPENLCVLCDAHHHHAHNVERAEAEACGIIRRR